MKSYFHHAISILLSICSKSQPDDDPIGSKHVAVCVSYKVVFDGYLFTPYLKTTVYAIEASYVHNLQRRIYNGF